MDWRLETHRQLSSTSDYCWKRLKDSPASPIAVRACLQSEGRGSRGRSWSSADGNFYFSFGRFEAFKSGDPAPSALQEFCRSAPFLAALAAFSALQFQGRMPVGHSSGLCLKWPNDLLWRGQKAGGVLIETASREDGFFWVVGIGVNTHQLPSGVTAAVLPRKWHLSLESLARDILVFWDRWVADFAVRGQKYLVQEWQKRAFPRFTPVRTYFEDAWVEGSFGGLDRFGRLILLRPSGAPLLLETGEVLRMGERGVA